MVRETRVIEVDIEDSGIVFMFDHSHFWSSWHRKIKEQYKHVRGKTIDYYVKGFDNYELAKSFAVWHYVEKKNGNIRSYRLD